MRKINIYVLCCVVSLLLLACDDGSIQYANSSAFDSDASMVYVDTFNVSSSTFILDSLQTSNKSIALVGRFNDANIGVVSSKSYVIIQSNSKYIDENEPIYDSLVLQVKPTGYYYGDTTASYKMNICRVLEDIEPEPGDNYLYNNSHFNADTNNVLGEIEFKPRPSEKEEIDIKMSDILGREFFNKLIKGSEDFENSDNFQHYFKGLLLYTDKNNKAILGFCIDTAFTMVLYYHNYGEDDSKEVNFSPIITKYQFNEIVADRSSNPLLKNIGEDPISSNQLDNYSYVQGGTGLVTRIDFPTIRDLLLDDRHFKIIKAELVIQPSVIMNPDYLPDNLLLIVTNKHSDLLSKYTDGEGNDVKSTLNVDYMDRENTSYTWDITSFIEEITQVEESSYNGLLILPENYDSDFDHVIISDQKRSHFKTFLKLYVMYYE